ncbi:MAG TPA: FKBP-type peptidyl-prolyl cis-trans isomerase [Vicinamibacterales bacterium]|nr:FKBP-type peptidyl-prolyl cis-trans isomerase [Vicinamibacterales bacterium]
MKQIVSLAVSLVLVAFMSACANSPTTPAQQPAFTKIDLTLGNGAVAQSGNTLTVTYTGWLYDPTKPDFKGLPFDSESGFSFALGTGQVIPGWDQGLVGMNVGGFRRLLIPASLAYGADRNGMIPPNAALVFDIQLTNVQ